MKLVVTGESGLDHIDVTGGQQARVIDVTAALVSSVNGRTGAVTGLAETDDVEATAEAAVDTHSTAPDPHQDRAWADATFLPLSGGTATGPLYGPGTTSMPPSANGLLGWSYDPVVALNNAALTAGVIHLSKVWINQPGTVTKLATRTISQAGVGLTNSYMGLYDSSGNRLAVTPDLSSNWMGSTGNRVHSLAASASITAPGWYYVAWLIGALTTSPQFTRATGTDIHNVNLTAGSYRAATYGTGQTSLPAAITMTSTASFLSYLWAGVA